MKLIRKITIGTEYKQNCMSYSINRPVSYAEKMKGFKLHAINETKTGYDLYIEKNQEVYPWKSFNKNMAISVEYDIDKYEESV